MKVCAHIFEIETPWENGRMAALAGAERDTNPYDGTTELCPVLEGTRAVNAAEWYDGFDRGIAQLGAEGRDDE